jgi:hypothetical protein
MNRQGAVLDSRLRGMTIGVWTGSAEATNADTPYPSHSTQDGIPI